MDREFKREMDLGRGQNRAAGVRVRQQGRGRGARVRPGHRGRGRGPRRGAEVGASTSDLVGAERRARAALTFRCRLGRRQTVAVFRAATSGSGRSSGATGTSVRVGLGAEVRASGRAGGQPGEEHGRVAR
jgi:hypothetical protein